MEEEEEDSDTAFSDMLVNIEQKGWTADLTINDYLNWTQVQR